MLRRELVHELLQRWHVTAAKCRDVSTPQRLNRAETRVEPVTRLGLRLESALEAASARLVVVASAPGFAATNGRAALFSWHLLLLDTG